MKVLILGAGKMVEAILLGLQNETDLSQYYVYSPSGKSAELLSKKAGVHFVSSLDEVKDPAWVWLGCKPQQLNDLAKLLNGKFPQATFLSMLAAISESEQRKILGVSKLVRIMPNLIVRFKKGITLISSQSATEEIKHVQNLFSLLGLAQIVTESELEELTLLTGSGPALFYEFTKHLAASFTSLSELERENLARMVLSGSGVSLDSTSLGLDDLIGQVTSKAGVTIAVLQEWRRLKLNDLIHDGIDAGKKRSAEISQNLRGS